MQRETFARQSCHHQMRQAIEPRRDAARSGCILRRKNAGPPSEVQSDRWTPSLWGRQQAGRTEGTTTRSWRRHCRRDCLLIRSDHTSLFCKINFLFKQRSIRCEPTYYTYVMLSWSCENVRISMKKYYNSTVIFEWRTSSVLNWYNELQTYV